MDSEILGNITKTYTTPCDENQITDWLAKLEITNIQIAIFGIIGCISLLKCQKVDKSFPNFCPFFQTTNSFALNHVL